MSQSLGMIFDEVADLYDEVRPSYPDAVAEALAAVLPPGGSALEIGTGTGQATRILARRGYTILGLEPGARLAARAAQNLDSYPNVTLTTTTFENWPVQPKQFDIVLSATAFHWVTPEIRDVKSAQALRDQGYLALLWNTPPDEQDSLFHEIQGVYDRCLPESVNKSARQSLQTRIARWVDEIRESGLFEECTISGFPWSEWYSTERYLQLLDTYSDHRPLPEQTKRCLYGGIAEILERHGGGIQHQYVAILILARKRPG